MKYTRYDYKKPKDGRKVITLFILMITLALIGGFLLLRYVIMPASEGDVKDAVNSEQTLVEHNDYILVQCGFYSKKENADTVKNNLKTKYSPFAITDGDKVRVGVYFGSFEEADKISKQLTLEGLNNLKIKFSVPKNDLCAKELCEIVNGYLQIVHKLEEKDVKTVKSDDFKKWTNNLEEDSKSSLFSDFKELKDNINSLPAEVKKENLESCYNAIFKALNQFKVK